MYTVCTTYLATKAYSQFEKIQKRQCDLHCKLQNFLEDVMYMYILGVCFRENPKMVMSKMEVLNETFLFYK